MGPGGGQTGTGGVAGHGFTVRLDGVRDEAMAAMAGFFVHDGGPIRLDKEGDGFRIAPVGPVVIRLTWHG